MKKFILGVLAITSVSFAQTKYTPELLWKFKRLSDMQVSPDGKTILYGLTTYDLAENKGNRELFVLPAMGGEPKQITNTKGSEQNARWRADGKKIGFISSKNGTPQIYEIDPDGNNEVQVTNIEGGINEFFYGTSGNAIVFTKNVKLGKTVNDIYPDMPKANARIYDDLMYRHWDTWEDMEYSHVFYASYADGKLTSEPTDIMKDERYDAPVNPHGDISEVAMSPNGRYIAYDCKKMNGKEDATTTNSEIYLYDTQTKTTINISKGHDGYDMEPVFSSDSKQIAWRSMVEPGYESDVEHILVYDIEKATVVDHTPTSEQNFSNIRWSANGKTIYALSYIRATEQVFSLDMASNKLTQITTGVNDYKQFTVNNDKLYTVKNSMSYPADVFATDLKTKKETQLTFVNKAMLAEIKMGKVEERNITTSDGKKMLVWVIYPPNFDNTKKYPAVLFCQGGPHGPISQSFSYRWNFQLMASQGYIVVAPNRHGLGSFGKAWNDQIVGDWGGQNMKDYLTAIDSVSALPYVDKNNLGCVGASYGGYSVYYLAGNHNKRFKTFIAHAGLFNLYSMYATTEEFFFVNKEFNGPFWKKNKWKGYDAFSPHTFVGNWDTPILVIHGEKDYRVPVSEGMQAFNAAQLRGIPSRFLTFPEENHWILSPQNSIVWHREFYGWLDKWLKK